VVLSPLEWETLPAAAAVAVDRAGRVVLIPGSLPLVGAAVVGAGLGLVVQEVHEPHSNLHVGALVTVDGVRSPAGVQTVGQITDAAMVLSR